ncbi:MAG: hypothetical protein KDA31_00095 [Phycisphaerales bacterium]|nr:hypothetical protein [Phycisphaerales bacterium]MCB9837325.1 hypothetical protein [Phycisphaera sp.]
MGSRQIILFQPRDPEDAGAGMAEIGSPRSVERTLRPFNIAPDGAKGAIGTLSFYGPGLVIEVPIAADEINQLMASVDDEETAWPVLARICRELGWKMMDPESGRTFM